MNKFQVGVMGDKITFSCPLPPTISKDDAFNLATWLIVTACVIGPGIYTDPKKKIEQLLDEALES
ncbi:MAG: hypothetical protein PHI12_08450 [Dehalococcoidales bacterium]|nr:hypothetical protein [Dehalococcoidales bacterium]